MAKVTVQGNYQFSEANMKDAAQLRSFGWLVGRRTEHENKKGVKVFTIRRELDYAADPILRKSEKEYEKYVGKAQKKMKRRHGWGQFFAIVFTIVGLAVGGVLLAAGFVAAIGDIINPVFDSVKEMFEGTLDAETLDMIISYIPYAFLGIGGISLLSIFINKGRFKKRLITPKRKYAKKYNAIARNALASGAERVRVLKEEKKYLMTRSDRRISEIGSTFQRVMDRNGEVEFD